MSLWLVLALLPLAVHRVTRFVTRDGFPLMAIPRQKFCDRWSRHHSPELQERVPEARNDTKHTRVPGEDRQTNVFMHSLTYLWECDWCVSVWIAAGVTYLTWRWVDVMVWVLLGLTASSVTGLIAQREPE